MRRDLVTSAVAVLVLTALCGLVYPLAVTGVAQLAFGDAADGSLVKRGDRVVGSRLIGQDFGGRARYFQSRPSPTGYAADATAFSNAGPNSAALRTAIEKRTRAYMGREHVARADVPAGAVMTSASGIDPHISVADARIQAVRVARARGLAKARVLGLVDRYTDGRGAGLLGAPGVNVLELNLALDR